MDGKKIANSTGSKAQSLDEKLKLIVDSIGSEKVKFDEDLKYHTAVGISRVAKLFTVASSERELIRLVEYCQQLGVPFLMIGTGSKVVIDEQFEGVVIKNRTAGIKIVSIKGQVSKVGIGVESAKIEIESGVIMQKLVEFLQRQGLEHQDFINVTGSMGGNIFLNRSLQDNSEQVKVLNLDSDIEIISSKELNLRQHIVLSVVLKTKSSK